MPKLKTKKGVAKRFKLSKNKKVKYTPCSKSHLLTSKEPRRLRRLRRKHVVDGKKDIKMIRVRLPYG